MRGSHPNNARLRRTSWALVGALCVATISIGTLSAGFWKLWAADLKGPTPTDRQVSIIVTSLLNRDHLSKHKVDNEIAERSVQSFLNTLDHMKLYFYQSDVDEFLAQQQEVDDMVQKGDVQFAYRVFNRFLQRVDQRVQLVNELLKQEYDFTVDEEIVADPDALSYPKDEAEARDRWRKRIKYDLLMLKLQKKEGQEAIDRLTRRYQSFAKRMHQTSNDELLEMFLTSVTTSFDPHTSYMSPSSLENFRIMMRLNLEGIGAALKYEDGYTVVSKIIPGGAADKAGQLKVEDRIVAVGQGEKGELEDVVDMKLGDVVDKIRGDAGTVVRLGVLPEGATEMKVYAITRAKIELKDSEARGIVFNEQLSDGKPVKIGVIDLPSFYMDMEAAKEGATNYKSTTEDVRRILEDFKKQGVQAVVLDLRRNGGGSLTEAIRLTGLFVKEGPVVQVKDSDGRIQVYDDLEPGMAWDGPLVVVISKFSASASEILAGAVQDYRRGIIVGDESTHGKGTVQSLLDLGPQLFRGLPNAPNLGALKITMQQFYRPNGDSTQKRGVLSDIVLPSFSNYLEGVAEADLDYAIEFDQVPAARYATYDMVSSSTIEQLRTRSTARLGENEEFQKLLKDIEKYQEQKARKSVTLHEEKFMARRAELDANSAEEKQFEQQAEGNEEIFVRDYYGNEVIQITLDYLRAVGANKIAQAR